MGAYVKLCDVINILNRQMEYLLKEHDRDGANAIDNCISCMESELSVLEIPGEDMEVNRGKG